MEDKEDENEGWEVGVEARTREGEGVEDREAKNPLPVALRQTLAVPVAESAALTEGGAVTVPPPPEPVAETDTLPEIVPPTPAPSRVLNVAGTEALRVGLWELLAKAEALGLDEAVSVRVRVGVGRGEEEDVARSVTSADSLCECLGVEEAVEVKEGEGELVIEAPPAWGLPVAAEEEVAVAPPGNEGVRVALREGVKEGVGGKVMDGVINGEPEGDRVGLGVARVEGRAVGVGEVVPPEKEEDGVEERERERDKLGVTVVVNVLISVVQDVKENRLLCDGVTLIVGKRLGLPVVEVLSVRPPVDDKVELAHLETEAQPEVEEDALGKVVADTVRLNVTVNENICVVGAVVGLCVELRVEEVQGLGEEITLTDSLLRPLMELRADVGIGLGLPVVEVLNVRLLVDDTEALAHLEAEEQPDIEDDALGEKVAS